MEEIKVTEWHQMTLDEYMAAKEEIKRRLHDIANDYIYIGYQLRKIQESEAYRQDGYETLAEFAKKEYGLSESATSRFIAINIKFSIGGYSPNLLEDFENFGSSKLSEMLTLSEADCKLIKETTTVATIRDIKKFNKEEQEIVQADVVTETFLETDREEQEENAPEEPQTQVKSTDSAEKPLATSQEEQGQQWTDIQQIIMEFFRDKKELLDDIYELGNNEDIAEMINPSGNLTFRKGIHMLFLYPYSEGVALKTFAKPNEAYTWPEFIKIIAEVFGTTYTAPGTVWENFYGKEEKKEKSAPAQVKSRKSGILETCDVASTEKTASPNKIKEKPDLEEEKTLQQEEKEEEKPASPSKIKENEDSGKKNEEIEGQTEIEEYFDASGDYHIPEEREEKKQEKRQENVPGVSILHVDGGLRFFQGFIEIERAECVDELMNVLDTAVGTMVAKGYDAEISFTKKGI